MIGYLSSDSSSMSLPVDHLRLAKNDKDKFIELSKLYIPMEFEQYQNIGVFDIQNTFYRKDEVNVFRNNTFVNIYAQRTGIYKI